MKTRVITEVLHGHWSAFFENSPQFVFGGDTAATAVMRLLESAGLPPDQLEVDECGNQVGRQVFRVLETVLCPDCRGSGKYVGLVTTADCETCGGAGHVYSDLGAATPFNSLESVGQA